MPKFLFSAVIKFGNLSYSSWEYKPSPVIHVATVPFILWPYAQDLLCCYLRRPDVCQAEVTNVNIRGGRMKRKMHSFSQQTSLDGM